MKFTYHLFLSILTSFCFVKDEPEVISDDEELPDLLYTPLQSSQQSPPPLSVRPGHRSPSPLSTQPSYQSPTPLSAQPSHQTPPTLGGDVDFSDDEDYERRELERENAEHQRWT